MWHLPREIFDSAIESLNKVRRLKKNCLMKRQSNQDPHPCMHFAPVLGALLSQGHGAHEDPGGGLQSLGLGWCLLSLELCPSRKAVLAS